MIPSFALAVPHTPWVTDRVRSMFDLMQAIGGGNAPPGTSIRHFIDREPNVEWSRKLWAWGDGICAVEGATHLLQLQDDATVAPNFWTALSAMVAAVPDQIIGLQGAHPAFRLLARDGHKWARSHAWMVGVGYVIPRDALAELVKFRSIFDGIAHEKNEDDFIAWFCTETGRDVWHPIPTIIDHTPIPSTYGNDANKFQRPTVTWREFGADEITRADFWTPAADVPIVANPHLNRCWFCQQEPGTAGFQETGALIGRACIVNALASILKVGLKT